MDAGQIVTGLRSSNALRRTPHAFTLVELLVVCVLVMFLGLTLLPALARSKPSGRSWQCFNNARQLAAAMGMYTEDNTQLFPPNPDDGNTTDGHNWCAGDVCRGAFEEYNPDILTNLNKSLLAVYISQNPDLFRCPCDTRHGIYSGTDMTRRGKMIVPAARSIAMNLAVGTVCSAYSVGSGHSGAPKHPTNGSFLDGCHGHRHDSPWATFGKIADFRLVKPSQIFLFADENPNSINDACLNISASVAEWIDYPADYHDNGCTFSFCDGHVELHRWSGKALVLTSDDTPRYFITGLGPDYDDWAWVKDHTTFRVQE